MGYPAPKVTPEEQCFLDVPSGLGKIRAAETAEVAVDVRQKQNATLRLAHSCLDRRSSVVQQSSLAYLDDLAQSSRPFALRDEQGQTLHERAFADACWSQ